MNTTSLSSLLPRLGNLVHVENLPSRMGNGVVRNQFELLYDNGSIFQSYTTFIGAKVGGELYLSSYHDYSKTTSLYCGRWCGKNTAERWKGLKNGTIHEMNLD